MGIFNIITRQTSITESLLPDVAKNEIIAGRLPHLNTTKIFLKNGEYCVYVDKAILNVKVKKRITHHIGSSSRGLYKGHRVGHGVSTSRYYTEIEQKKGLLYITNKRIIFQSSEAGLDKLHRYLSAIDFFNNGIILQYGKKGYEFIVPNNEIVSRVLKLVN